MSRKAVFFDIDGTLWDEHFVIPESAKEAIRKLRENGHLAFLCSGRTRAFIQDERLLTLGFDGIVAGCGTWIEMDGKTLFYKKLEQELIEDTIHILKEYGIPTVYEGSRNLYMDLEEFEEDPYGLRLKETLGEDLLPVTGNEAIMEISSFPAPHRMMLILRYFPIWKRISHRWCMMRHAQSLFQKDFPKRPASKKPVSFLVLRKKIPMHLETVSMMWKC